MKQANSTPMMMLHIVANLKLHTAAATTLMSATLCVKNIAMLLVWRDTHAGHTFIY